LRRHATDAERKLWAHLSARQVAGTRFNRQFPIGPFICDFVSRSARLIVEVDGGQHGVEVEADARRTAFLERQGYRVLRFWNNDVLANPEGVIQLIEQALLNSPSPDPSRKREGSESRDRSTSLPPSRLREGPGEGLSKQ
jgi:very-short-patch-repair endonuclease